MVDLCHFGLPDHYAGFGDRTWIEGFVRYVESFLARYPNPMWFTPVNEPLITALCSGMWGIWNDRRASRHDYMRVLAHVTLANLEAIARISADRAGWWIGAEGFGCHLAATPEDQPAATAARDLDQLTWDLHLGVDPPSSVADVFDVVDSEVLARISDLAGPTERVVAGHDFYPISVMVHGVREEPLSITERVGAYEREARAWHARYQRPFWVAETSNLGLAVGDGPRWLHELVGALDRLCADGLPARGVCWYSRGDQVDWHTMLAHPIGEITEVGLFDAARRPRQVAQAYGALANQRAKQHRTRETMAT